MTHKQFHPKPVKQPSLSYNQAALIYTNAYRDGYLEATKDTRNLTIKRMLDHNFDEESIQRTLGISAGDIQNARESFPKQNIFV